MHRVCFLLYCFKLSVAIDIFMDNTAFNDECYSKNRLKIWSTQLAGPVLTIPHLKIDV